MRDLDDAFAQLGADVSGLVSDGDPRVPVRKAQRRRAVAAGGGVAVVAALVVGGVLLAQPGHDRSAPRLIPATQAPEPTPTQTTGPSAEPSTSPSVTTSSAPPVPPVITTVPSGAVLAQDDLDPAATSTASWHHGRTDTAVTTDPLGYCSVKTAVLGATALHHDQWNYGTGSFQVDDTVVVLPDEGTAQAALDQVHTAVTDCTTPGFVQVASFASGGETVSEWHTKEGEVGVLPVTLDLVRVGWTVVVISASTQGESGPLPAKDLAHVHTVVERAVTRANTLG